MKGRKRHLLVDTGGLVLRALVGSAGEQDWQGGLQLGRAAALALPTVRTVWADRAYWGFFADVARRDFGWELVIVGRPPGLKGFVPQPRRWVVERAFAWLGRSRRLSKDYEQLPLAAEAFLYLASIQLLLRRLAP